jgi:IclR family KDG regulon transcriptional repressor
LNTNRYDSDATSVAAPIFDYTNKIMAGLTLAGPAERIKSYDQQELIDMVCRVARQVSIALGSSLYD